MSILSRLFLQQPATAPPMIGSPVAVNIGLSATVYDMDGSSPSKVITYPGNIHRVQTKAVPHTTGPTRLWGRISGDNSTSFWVSLGPLSDEVRTKDQEQAHRFPSPEAAQRYAADLLYDAENSGLTAIEYFVCP